MKQTVKELKETGESCLVSKLVFQNDCLGTYGQPSLRGLENMPGHTEKHG